MKSVAALLLLCLSAMAADVSGTWTGTFAVPGSDHKEPQYFILKLEGKKLAGSGGPDAVEQYPIVSGTFENDRLVFNLTSGDWTFSYDLKLAKEDLTGSLHLRNKSGDTRTATVRLKKVLPNTGRHTTPPQAQDAVPAIVELFDRFPIVAIGEGHWLQEAGDFYVSLVNDPGFQAKVNDIVIEFGSQRSQPILDRYINGEDVSPEELRTVWRDTTKVFAFESPIYAQFLAAVRDVNRRLPRAHQLRILAGDAPIDWSKVTTHEQWAAFQPNDESFAEVIDKQILARGRKALVMMGGSHLTKSTDPGRDANTTMLIEREHPGAVYVALMDQKRNDSVGNQKPPILIPTAPPYAGDYSDALLYLGDDLTWAHPDWKQYDADPSYLKELDRRARIEWGCGFDLNRFEKGQMPCP